MNKLSYMILGIGLGAAGHFGYRKYFPERKVSISKHEMIKSYLQKNNMERGYLINVMKSLGLILKGFVEYGMDIKIQGFNYYTTFLNKQQVKNQDKNIQHLSCIFSPTIFICGHPQIQHGGATAALIDQNFGYLAMLNAKSSVATADLHVAYRKPIRVDQFYVFQARVTARQGRKVWVKGEIKQLQTGEVKVQAQGLFMAVNWDNQFTRVLTKFFSTINFKDYNDVHHTQALHQDYIQESGKKITQSYVNFQKQMHKLRIQHPSHVTATLPPSHPKVQQTFSKDQKLVAPSLPKQKKEKSDPTTKSGIAAQTQKIKNYLKNKDYLDHESEAKILKMEELVQKLEDFDKKQQQGQQKSENIN